MMDLQFVAAAERATDRRLFGGDDRRDDRFVRLPLRSSSHTLLVADKEPRTVVFEPRLYLHRSGVLQLTVQVSTEEVSLGQLLTLLRADRVRFSTSRLPEPILRHARISPAAIRWQDSTGGGARVGEVSPAAEWTTLEFLMKMHVSAVEHAIGTRTTDTRLFYPTAIIQADGCCPAEGWTTRHRTEIGAIASKATLGAAPNSRLDPGEDFSIHRDHVFHLNLGSATYLQFDGEAPRGIAELHTVLVVEHALSLYSQLRALESRTMKLQLRGRQLRDQYAEAIPLFVALRQNAVRYGTARDITRHLLRELGGDELRESIQAALQLSGQAQAAVDAARGSSRSFWLTAVGTVLAALVAVPVLSDVIDSLAQLPSGSRWDVVLTLPRRLYELEPWAPWLVIAAVLAACVSGWALSQIRPWRRRRLRVGGRGPTWDRRFEEKHDETSVYLTVRLDGPPPSRRRWRR